MLRQVSRKRSVTFPGGRYEFVASSGLKVLISRPSRCGGDEDDDVAVVNNIYDDDDATTTTTTTMMMMMCVDDDVDGGGGGVCVCVC